MIVKNSILLNEDSNHDILNAIDKIEEENPRLTIIKPFYHSENELDSDWKKFLFMSTGDKNICDTKSHLLYKLSNSSMYKKLKRKFIEKDKKKELITSSLGGNVAMTEASSIESDIEVTHVDSVDELLKTKDERAKRFMLDNNYQYEMILSAIDNLEELNRSFYRYQNMSDKDKFESDEESKRIYGKSNEERYFEQLERLLSLEEPNDIDIEQEYESSNESLVSNLKSLNCLLEETSIDTRERNKYERKKTQLFKANLAKSIINKLDLEQVSLRTNVPYYTPNERTRILKSYATIYPSSLELGVPRIPDEKWDLNYEMRFVGLRPMEHKYSIDWKVKIHDNIKVLQNESASDEDKEKSRISLLELGWNPVLKDSVEDYSKAQNRVNSILRQQYPYKFLNISEGFVIGQIDPKVLDKVKGLFIVFVNYYKNEEEKTRVYLSLDSSLNKLYALDCGMMYNVETFDNIKNIYTNSQYEEVYLKVYFLSMEQSLIDKIKKQFEYLNSNYTKFGYNFLLSLCNMMRFEFQVSNYNLFCSYIMNYIIALANIDLRYADQCYIRSTLSMNNFDYDDNIISYIIYEGKLEDYRPNEIINKLGCFINGNVIKESMIYELESNGVDIQKYTITPLKEASMNSYQYLNEFSTNHVSFKEEGLLSAIRKCIDQIKKSKNKNNINDMEKYSCKLWELRILLVDQLRFTKNNKMITNLYNTKIGLEDALYNTIQFIRGTRSKKYDFRKVFSDYNCRLPLLDKVSSYPDLEKIINGFNNI